MAQEIDLNALRKIIIKSQEEEIAKKRQTQLFEKENPHRKKVKKINPKFCCEWSQLDCDLQVNRIIEFVSRFGDENDLSTATTKKIRKMLVSSLVNEKLQVKYDSSIGIITSIPKLYYSDSKGYYLGTYLNDNGEFIFRVSKISDVKSGGDQKMTITTEDYQSKKSLNIIKKKTDS